MCEDYISWYVLFEDEGIILGELSASAHLQQIDYSSVNTKHLFPSFTLQWGGKKINEKLWKYLYTEKYFISNQTEKKNWKIHENLSQLFYEVYISE